MFIWKSGFTIISFFSFILSTYAQDFDKVYFDNNWAVTSIDEAKFYRTSQFSISPLSYDGEIKDYYLSSNQIEMTGNYSNGIKKGEFRFYYENGNIKLILSYNNNLRTGKWTQYYSNGQIKVEVEYKDKMEKVLNLNDSTGKSFINNDAIRYKMLYYDVPSGIYDGHIAEDDEVELRGKLINGYRDGKWKIIKNGEVHAVLKYDEGTLLKGYILKREIKTKLSTDYSDIFPLIVNPKKFYMTENFVQKAGSIIKNNYVTDGLYKYKLLNMDKVEIDSKDDLIKYIQSHFDIRSKKSSKTITINLIIENHVPIDVNTEPTISQGSLEELKRLLNTIGTLKFESKDIISFSYVIELFDVVKNEL